MYFLYKHSVKNHIFNYIITSMMESPKRDPEKKVNMTRLKNLRDQLIQNSLSFLTFLFLFVYLYRYYDVCHEVGLGKFFNHVNRNNLHTTN